MENEKENRQPKKQCFYFNENGQLVVESNKGVWVDGEQSAKMYGDFTCSAKTMGTIIAYFKNKPIIVGEKWRFYGNDNVEEDFCLVDPEQRINEMIEHAQERGNKWYKKSSEIDKKYKEIISKFNRLPWWKRMFKKVEI